MAYTVLARRYRSSTFDEVVGQEHIAQTLKKAIASGRIAHAYLFCGTRGTGKTSTARILAKCLNCEKNGKEGGPTAEPDNTCPSCQAIARGDDIDVIEIDAASNTGVDNIRELIENSQYRPSRSRFKVYIIDEAHMLSKQAFNALLKTLEEPPSHVKFILATTEPEKLLPTILSRCQRYDFRNIPTREIAAHLAAICHKEKIDADEDALLLVAKTGAGSMRDSLSLLDRLLSVGEKKLTAKMIEQLLGLPPAQLVFDLCQAIGGGDVKATLTQVEAILAGGQSVDGLLSSLVDHLRNLLILSTCGSDSALVEVPGLALAELAKQAARFDAVVLSQDIAILEELRRTIRQAQAGRALLDATLVRLALADQFTSVADLLAGVESGAAGTAQKKKSEINAHVAGSGLHVESAPPATSVQQTTGDTQTTTDDDDDDDLARPGKVWQGERQSLAALMSKGSRAFSPTASAPPAAEARPVPAAEVAPDSLPGQWNALLAALSDQKSLSALLEKGRFTGIEDSHAVIRYAYADAHMVKLLDRNEKREIIRGALGEILRQSVGVRFEIDPAPAATVTAAVATAAPAATTPVHRAVPNQQAAGAGEAAVAPAAAAGAPVIRLTAELRAELEADPFIKTLIEEFGATIVKVE